MNELMRSDRGQQPGHGYPVTAERGRPGLRVGPSLGVAARPTPPNAAEGEAGIGFRTGGD